MVDFRRHGLESQSYLSVCVCLQENHLTSQNFSFQCLQWKKEFLPVYLRGPRVGHVNVVSQEETHHAALS